MNTTQRALSEVKRDAKRLLKQYVRTSPEARTPVLRALAEVFVEAREHFARQDGSPDWKGRSYPYRQFVRDLYDSANLGRDDASTLQAAIRYHVGQVLRERLDDATLQEYDLIPQSPRQRSHERRQERTAVLNALSAREINGGALLALSAAYTILSRLDVEELSDLDDRSAVVADETLRDLERRIRQLRQRLK